MLFVVARKMIVAQSKNFIDEGALGFLNFYRKGAYCVGIDKTKRIIFAEKIKNVISDIFDFCRIYPGKNSGLDY